MALPDSEIQKGYNTLRDLSTYIWQFEGISSSLKEMLNQNNDYQKFSKGTGHGAKIDNAFNELLRTCNSEIIDPLKMVNDKTKSFLARQEEINSKGR